MQKTPVVRQSSRATRIPPRPPPPPPKHCQFTKPLFLPVDTSFSGKRLTKRGERPNPRRPCPVFAKFSNWTDRSLRHPPAPFPLPPALRQPAPVGADPRRPPAALPAQRSPSRFPPPSPRGPRRSSRRGVGNPPGPRWPQRGGTRDTHTYRTGNPLSSAAGPGAAPPHGRAAATAVRGRPGAEAIRPSLPPSFLPAPAGPWSVNQWPWQPASHSPRWGRRRRRRRRGSRQPPAFPPAAWRGRPRAAASRRADRIPRPTGAAAGDLRLQPFPAPSKAFPQSPAGRLRREVRRGSGGEGPRRRGLGGRSGTVVFNEAIGFTTRGFSTTTPAGCRALRQGCGGHRRPSDQRSRHLTSPGEGRSPVAWWRTVSSSGDPFLSSFAPRNDRTKLAWVSRSFLQEKLVGLAPLLVLLEHWEGSAEVRPSPGYTLEINRQVYSAYIYTRSKRT